MRCGVGLGRLRVQCSFLPHTPCSSLGLKGFLLCQGSSSQLPGSFRCLLFWNHRSFFSWNRMARLSQDCFDYLAGKHSVPLWRGAASSDGRVLPQTWALDTDCDSARHWDRARQYQGAWGLQDCVAGST